MIEFVLNGEKIEYSGDENVSLLQYLRLEQYITSPKDGCSGQAACGACLVEADGKPVLSCSTPMKKIAGKTVVTLEGFPENIRRTLGRAFVAEGGVQCGFCTPGILTRIKILLQNNPDPSREDVVRALNNHLCRCTGYVKIIGAVLAAAKALRENGEIEWESQTGIGRSSPKYDGYNRALGQSPFMDDMSFDGMVHGALKFSDHPRARVLAIDASEAEAMPGVIRIYTSEDIPGKRFQGVIEKDWPMMVATGEITRCISDVLAGVVAETEAQAREAAKKIKVEYEVLEPLTEMTDAEKSPIKVHESGNLLKETVIRRGDAVGDVFARSAFVAEGVFETPFIDHGFLETESSIGLPEDGGVRVYSQSQGIFKDRDQIAPILNLPDSKVNVVQVPTGGAFGGKEDLTVQHHGALYSLLLDRPVKVRLSRPESIRMHPKRHRMKLDYKLGCDAEGRLTGLKARIVGDTGAYASVGGEVVARTGTHAGGAYYVPNVDVVAGAYYTNNPPAGAFRGFGVNQATFAMESMVEELCRMGGFDPWQFRYDNALDTGLPTTTGHILGQGIGLRECLLAVKDEYSSARYAGLACAIKNVGIGNGLEEVSQTRLKVVAPNRIEIQHGWTEMGQGIQTVARQILGEVIDLDPSVKIDVKANTGQETMGGVTTASRGTVLLGNSILTAAGQMKEAMGPGGLADMIGREFFATYGVDWTTPHEVVGEIISHFSYGYAAQVAVLDNDGNLSSILAAHDGGRIINPALFEGQVEGGVAMGVGYALKEKLELDGGYLKSDKMIKLGLPRAKDMPDVKVILVECPDPHGPFGAKGVGEIGSIPTAPAIANAFTKFDGMRRYKLPLEKPTVKKASESS